MENWPTIIIENVLPEIDQGKFAAKCIVGEKFSVEADIFKDGQDILEAVLLYKKKNDAAWNRVPMRLVLENDRWQAFFIPTENARYLYTVEAWVSPDGPHCQYQRTLELMVDRKAAGYSAWYEFFPRSQSQEPGAGATFKDCIPRLKDVKKMGFDIVYLPPIHPIGITNRKGPDNVLIPGEKSPGSPWAIGNKEGGHKAIHPELGGISEFKVFVAVARNLGLEIAIDIAFQCSPDHPYVKDHPQWFFHRPDGSIHYAENPPKKYEDIYPLNFYCDDWKNLWNELKSVIVFWIEHGINVFRVDNPHTKPLYFWKWLIDEIQKDYPQVIFLSEAFSRPKIMKFLGKAGFTQSYTYFTWRNTKWELRTYLQELTTTDMKDYFRGNFFTNTPDILSGYLQKGGVPAFKIRAVLAATLSSIYGIYSGFELCENEVAKPDSEDYANSEKYEIKIREWDKPGNIKDLIARINAIRQENSALQEYKNLEFYETFNEQVFCYGKRTTDNSNIIIVVVNLDPFNAHEDTVTLPLAKFGIKEGQSYQMHDLLTGVIYSWKGASNYVRLDPQYNPAHIFKLILS
jgi:starch synthase (maltosyl-transferring)